MPSVDIPINGSAYQNIDEVELSNLSPSLIDGYVNEAGHTCRRPGLLEWTDLGTGQPVDGEYWWDKQSLFLVVSGGRIFKINSDGVATELTGATLSTGTKVTFADNGTYCIMANGGQMVYTDGLTATVMADVDAPVNVTHVVFLDGYIICNSVGTAKFHYSDPIDVLDWNALDFASAEGAPDDVIAIHVGWREIMLVGAESIETWYNDGVTPFSRYTQGFIQRGCSAPYTMKLFNNTWYFLDEDRQLIKLEGRSPVSISGPFDKTFQSIADVSDATGDIVTVGGKVFYVLNFPTEGKTFAYHIKSNDWAEWSWWNGGTATYERHIASCFEYAKGFGKVIAGSRKADGKVFIVSFDYNDDNGDLIRILRRTGHIDHDTYNRKKSSEILFRLKRGAGDDGDITNAPYIMVRYRTDGKATWSNERRISLGLLGDTDIIARMTRLGIYRTRQYEIVLTDKTPLVLVGAKEKIEVLR